jgi:hypothetical protein
MKHSWMRCLGVLSAVAAVACGGSAPAEQVGTATAAVSGGPHLLWYNKSSGAFSAWLLSGETVTGTQELDVTCSEADGCRLLNEPGYSEQLRLGPEWILFDVSGNTIWWWNRISGQVSRWVFDNNGHVTFPQDVTWTCDAASDCARLWTPIGVVSLSSPCSALFCFPTQGILWHNWSSGEVSIWMLLGDGRTVTKAVSLNKRCGNGTGCSSEAFSTDDFDGDGNTDLLWGSVISNEHPVWLIKDTSGAVKGTQSFTVENSRRAVFPVISGDVDGDRFADLVQNLNGAWPSPDGIVPIFYLNGRGGIKANGQFSWSNTDSSWLPVGLVTFPDPTQPPPK